MKHLRSWWSRRKKPLRQLVHLAPIAFAACLFALYGWCEKPVRLTGLTFQLYGFAIGVCGILGTSHLFEVGLPIFLRRLLSPRRKTQAIFGSVTAVGGGDMVSARGYGSISDTATVQERLRRLEKSFENLFVEVGRVKDKHEAEIRSTQEKLQGLVEETNQEVDRLSKRLKKAFVDGLHLEWVAVLYFFVGVILATATPEIVDPSSLLSRP